VWQDAILSAPRMIASTNIGVLWREDNSFLRKFQSLHPAWNSKTNKDLRAKIKSRIQYRATRFGNAITSRKWHLRTPGEQVISGLAGYPQLPDCRPLDCKVLGLGRVKYRAIVRSRDRAEGQSALKGARAMSSQTRRTKARAVSTGRAPHAQRSCKRLACRHLWT
jgi:hypothetical protein